MRATVAAFPRTLRDNPYCDLLYTHLAAAGVEIAGEAELSAAWLWRNRRRVAVLHLHWPEFYYRGPRGAVTARSVTGFVASVLLAVALRYRLVWTIHNAAPHEGHAVDRLLRRLLLATARTVVHCPQARTAVRGGRWEPVVVPHGHYIGWYADGVTREEARRRLGLGRDEKVLLCFGQVRAYKGIEALARTFAEVPDPRLRLVVAGRPAGEAEAERLRALERTLPDPRRQMHLGYVPDDEVQVFFKACDLAVLPYHQVLTSGAAMLALSFGRGLIVPRLGCLGALAAQGCAIDYDPQAPDGLRRALEIAARVDATLLGQRARVTAEKLGWERIARAYARVYGMPPPAGRRPDEEKARRVSA